MNCEQKQKINAIKTKHGDYIQWFTGYQCIFSENMLLSSYLMYVAVFCAFVKD